MELDRIVAGAMALGLAVCSQADAGYIMSITHGGADSATVAPGDSIVLDILMTPEASESHNSAIFRVVFSEPGLRYDGYSWAAPYLNGTIDDDSKPLTDSLPMLLGESTLSGIGYPIGVVDIELSNVVPIGPNFGAGMVTSLTLTVPAAFGGAQQVIISLAPDEIALNGGDIPTRTDSFFTLIVPGPGGVAMTGLSFVAMSFRRRVSEAQV